MNKSRKKDIDPMAELEKAADLYEQYIQVSGIASMATVAKRPTFSAPAPAPMTISIG
ncbi:hypothetical protein PUR22_12820 [Mycolicibacterium porcinum]|uniref:hypothetical protein n=1 Tax=Mycolicibacterium porcinum TaxID=39693 RepID=UPI0031F7CFFC